MPVPPDQVDVAAFLRGLAGADPVETHISAVFRGTDTVWKLKKAVNLTFLDFRRPDERERLLRRELALNAPAAPELYRDVVAVTRTEAGDLVLGGGGPAVDWVLRMARVPDADFLDRMAAEGRIGATLLRDLADAVAALHAAQPPVPVPDPAARLLSVLRGNAAAARRTGIAADEWEAAAVAAVERAAPALRARAGLVRRAHGDLHLGNLLLWRGRPAPFDALEFDEDLATVDPGYDLAFLLMDLDRLVGRPAANAVLNRYVARTGDAGLVAGLVPFLSLRALIRAHVEAARGHGAADLVRRATGYLRPSRPAVLAVGGLMGTGKSTLARVLAPALGPAPGALVLRSDEIRKRLAGVPPEAALPPDAYTRDADARVAAALLDGVRAAAGGGHAAIADATFLDPALRAAVERAAAPLPFLGVWLHAPLPVLEARVAARLGDASDADVAVLHRAAARAALGAAPPPGWLALDATAEPGRLQGEVQARLGML